MRNKLIFAAGVGVGYLLGTRAGRERYEQMLAQARRVWENPTVQEAAGVVQAQANRLYDEGKLRVTDQVHRLHKTTNEPDSLSLSGVDRTDGRTGETARAPASIS